MNLLQRFILAISTVVIAGEVPRFDLVSVYPTSTFGFTGVTYGNGAFVAVGDSLVVFSTDEGVTWREAVGYPKMRFTKVLFGGDRFLAVGLDSQFATSFDGSRWTTPVLRLRDGLSQLTYGNGTFVGGRSNPALIQEGTFSLRIEPSFAAFGGGQFLLSSAITGIPGIYQDFLYTRGVIDLASDGTTFFAATSYYKFFPGAEIWVVFSSQNGSNWKLISTDHHNPYDPIRLISSGRYVWLRTYAPACIQLAGDVSMTIPSESTGAADGGSNIVVSTQAGLLRISTNAPSVLKRPNEPAAIDVFSFAASRRLVVAVGATNKAGTLSPQILASTNGLSGLASVTPPEGSGALKAVRFADGKFVTVGGGGTVLRSTDAVNWTRRLSNTTSDLFDVTYGNGLWVAVGANGKIVTSTDASVFGLRFSGTEVAINGICFGDNRFVGVGKDGLIVSSPNGIDWSATGTEEARTLNSVAYGNGRFVAVGTNGMTHFSLDGARWETVVIPNVTNLTRVAFGNGFFVALAATNNMVYATKDGRTWDSEQITGLPLLDVNFSDGELWLTGSKTTIHKTSLDPALAPRVAGAMNASRRFELTVHPNVFGNYQIEASTTISDSVWQRLTVLSNINSSTSWVDTNSVLSRKFYRVWRQ